MRKLEGATKISRTFVLQLEHASELPGSDEDTEHSGPILELEI